MKKTVFICVLVFVLGITMRSFCLEESPPAQEQITAVSGQAPKAITAIEIKGNKSISTNIIISKMKSRVGNPYQENVISDDLKRLYLLGFFSDIKIDTEPYKEGIKLIVTVAERPIIERITFSGMQRIKMKEDKLKEMIKSKVGQYLDHPILAEDVQILKKMYEKKGFSQAQVDYKTDIDPATNKAKVEFVVYEGKRIRIKTISIEGNTAFSDRRILGLMKTKKAWLFNAGPLKEEVLAEDMERVKSFYRRKGYADAAADYEVSADTKKPFLYINIRITEGKKYLVGIIAIAGNKDIFEKDIQGALKACTAKKVFSQEALQEDVTHIQGLYFDRGYIFAQIQEATSLNSGTGRIDINYNIAENQIAYVNKIKVRGNVKTKDVVIRRELRIRPGDRFDGEKLRRSKEKLQNLGFFEEISYDTEDSGEEANKKDLVVDVKESKTGAFSFGGGYSTVDQLVGFVEIEQKNFDWKNFPYFTGDGQNLKLRASFGMLSNSYVLSFTEPWVFDYPISFGFDAYQRSRQRESDVGYGYDEDVLGGDLRLGKELTEYLKADATYRIDNIEISNVAEEASVDLKKETGKNTISSMQFGLTYDSRDNVFSPYKGNVLAGSIEGAGGPFGGDKDFLKFFGRASHYFPLFNRSTLEFRGRVGLADPYGDSDDLPIYERFFAGGAYTIRGYEERSVGPIDPASKDPLGGEAMLIGNIEYTYPLFDFLKLAAFYDTGNVWRKLDDFGKEDLKSGIGFGVRLKTPIGPLMLDYGIPLDKTPGEEKKKSGRVHFSMSQSF